VPSWAEGKAGNTMKRVFLWKLLTDRGLFPDREIATSWIMSGRVLVNNHIIDKAGYLVPKDASVRIRDYDKKYVGKGGIKLEGALEDLGIDLSDKIVLDVGASIGGFTDCLLQSGASKVYAVDVGFGQLAGKLRIDKRVVNMERANISDIKPEQLHPKPTFATVDISYLSLTKAIPIVSRLLDQKGEMLCLVKPLFEVSDPGVRRTGKIDDFSMYKEVLHEIVNSVEEMGLYPIGITHSHVTGNKGTREFFLLISLEEKHAGQDIRSDINDAIEVAMKLPVFQREYSLDFRS